MSTINSIQDIANCKLTKPRMGPEAVGRRSSHFAFCNLQFAFCNVFLLVLCAILFFHRLADRDLWNSHEGRAAQDAQSLLDQGEWGMPHLFDGEPEMQKPPLYYWIVAGISRARGTPVDTWAVRLPASLAATTCVLGMFWWGCRRGRPVMGFVAAMVLATAVHFTWLGRVGRIDMPLTLCVCTALVGYFIANCKLQIANRKLAETQPRPSTTRPLSHHFSIFNFQFSFFNSSFVLSLAYVSVAVGILFKGPIAFALPAVVITCHLAFEKELPVPWHFRRWLALASRLGLWWGLPLVAALVLPCFLWANAATDGEWFRTFFWRHNVERGLVGDGDEHWNHPWWLYGSLFACYFLPWSVFVLPAIWYCFRNGWWRIDTEARFGLVWLVAMIGLLSCMHFKRADYLLPAYPGAAIFLGCIAERCYQEFVVARRVLTRKIAFAGIGLIVMGCIAGWLVYLEWDIPRKEATREYRRFAQQIREIATPGQPVLFFRTDRHALIFHVGQPVVVFVEWEKLDACAARKEPSYVVMPEQTAREWPLHLKRGLLEEVARNGQDHERPLVLLRTRSNNTAHDP